MSRGGFEDEAAEVGEGMSCDRFAPAREFCCE